MARPQILQTQTPFMTEYVTSGSHPPTSQKLDNGKKDAESFLVSLHC